LPIFHGSDERVYLVEVRERQLVRELQDGRVLGRVTGDELWRLRLVQVLISYGLALAVFALLHRRLALGQGQSLALSLLFVLSPYVCGTSFRLMTDNLALLFSVLAIDRLERFRERHRLGQFGLACACVAAAVLTRQSTAFMLGVAGLYALGARIPVPVRALAAAALGLAAIPAAALFLNWHGLVPPGGDPSSCGLCPAGRAGAGATQGQLTTATLELTLATIGLYGAVLFAPLFVHGARRARRELIRRSRAPLIGAGAGALLLLVRPAAPGGHAAGVIWNAAQRFPAVHGSSILFWALVPWPAPCCGHASAARHDAGW
jgi:hypothetical protein